MVFKLSIPYRHPLEAFAPISDEDWSLLMYGDGTRPVCICMDPVRTLDWTAGSSDPFEMVRQSLSGLRDSRQPHRHANVKAGFCGGWAGLIGYEFSRHVLSRLEDGPLRGDWPDLALGLYDAVAVFDPARKKACVLAHEWGARDPKTLARSIAQKLGQSAERHPALSSTLLPEAIVNRHALADPQIFCGQVKRVVDYIHAGDCLQANISHPLHFNAPCGPYAVFSHMVRQQPARFSTYMRLPKPGKPENGLALVSNSPERFLRLRRRRDGRLRASAEPIKGTRARHEDLELDQKLALQLTGSAKDRAENLMIVDLMRNDLAQVSLPGTVITEDICRLYSLAHQHHLVSRIGSVLAPGADAMHLLAAAFPGGSVTGAPKIRAMQIINEIEKAARGPYCGAFVRMEPDGEMDASILIRTAALARQDGVWQGVFRVGAGIVADSVPQDEYQETLVKGRAVFGDGLGRD